LDCSDDVKIDLHIHSNASDGTFSPAEIIAMAQALGLGAIAITDHDTIEGSREALRCGIPPSLGFLTGVEISAAPPPAICDHTSSVHILGYGLDLENAGLRRVLAVLQESRENRNPAILDRLDRLGFAIGLEEVMPAVGDGQIGRPHIARAMVNKGYVRSIDEAFERYLSRGRPAYVEKFRISCREAIATIRGAGGLPVLAHPALLRIADKGLVETMFRQLGEIGLQGIEVYYPEHLQEEVALYEKIAREHHLLMTGGTDFHGGINPAVQMGTGTGGFHVPYRIYRALRARLGNRSADGGSRPTGPDNPAGTAPA